MKNKIDDAAFWICVGFVLALACAGCVESPTAPTKEPVMILNPDLQGIA